jgi:uncharacterized protein
MTFLIFHLRLADNGVLVIRKNNNGVVVLVAKNDRKYLLHLDMALKAPFLILQQNRSLTISSFPISRVMISHGGLDQGTDALMEAARGEYKAPEGYGERGSKKKIPALPLIIIMIVVFMIVSRGGVEADVVARL